ncbi:F-box/kelch-repeat protein At3g23880-like [Vicia villosa]|uniref:F-box/kelch-repeat protein At3g23880-like n=1 Tax=Vicia villosa TaxID=3911 RepID=UPI00273C60F7|nr:F-box/kelch-repeat protein At3g23880-like [Vicia villosa]
MNFPPSQMQPSSNTLRSPVFLPDELVTEVLSSLPVKSFMRMRCLSKFSNSLYTNPIFIRMHLRRSAQNPHLTLGTSKTKTLVPFPVCHLLENPQVTLTDEPHYLIDNVCLVRSNNHIFHRIVGSCNGLICLFTYYITPINLHFRFRFWNPSTRIISKVLGNLCIFGDRVNRQTYRVNQPRFFKFSFGYDNLTSNFKIVLLNFQPHNANIIETKVLSLVDNIWRNIQNFPVFPLLFMYRFNRSAFDGVYLSGTVNWLAVFDSKVKSLENYVIISLDLGNERYTQMQLPHGFDEMPRVDPTIRVLTNSLCFSYDFRQTHFVIWRMMEFGVQESWTQFLTISYLNLGIDYNFGDKKFYLVPLHLAMNGDTLILASSLEDQAMLYNIRDNNVERTRNTDKIGWFSVKEYVESLVSISE